MALSQAGLQRLCASVNHTSKPVLCTNYACFRSPGLRIHGQSPAELSEWCSAFCKFKGLRQRKELFSRDLKISAAASATKLDSLKGVEQEIEGEMLIKKVSKLGISEGVSEILRKHIEITLISRDIVDEETGIGKTYGKHAKIEWSLLEKAQRGYTKYDVSFKWNSSLGVPGAFIVKNNHSKEFFLKSLTLNIAGVGQRLFKCNSWIYPAKSDKSQRIFFSNKSFLPDETPSGLVKLREKELTELRGDGTGERKSSDRIYDYDVYNDLGDPDKDSELARPVLGGSTDLPYPRRCRTGRSTTKTDAKFESRGEDPLYIPADERYPYEDLTDFRVNTFMTVITAIVPAIEGLVEKEFKKFTDVERLYGKGLESSLNSLKKAAERSPFEFVKELIDVAADIPIIRFNRPKIVEENSFAWRTDAEFARQTLAGVNPLSIKCLEKFPPSSKLDSELYGTQNSTITEDHVKKFLGDLTVEEAIASKRLFILDYYDVYMPYVERINNLSKDSNKTYATRSLFFLNENGTLDPVAIELCLPPSKDGKEAFREVYTPEEPGTEQGNLWILAKAHARGNDAGCHQLVSHWLTTHCVMEPFILATHRQLSSMHPIYKLLVPHYHGTMDINQSARQALINAEGIIERTFTSGKYSMEISSKAYKDWKFNEQGLPADLLKRALAVRDETAPHGLKLVINDHPYASDGLEIWSALKQWVSDYISLFYTEDESVKKDSELRAWWNEVVSVGHADLKDDESRWYKMDSISEMVDALTTLIWTASAHHSVVNFGQYPYGGYMPNMPTMTRRLLPEKGSSEFSEMMKDIEQYFLRTVSAPLHTTVVMAVLEILSSHGRNEIYIGQISGSTPEWADDDGVQEAFNKFSTALVEVEKNVINRNEDSSLKNRRGPSQVPYTLLYPNTTDLSRVGGVTGQGVPNSISI